VRREQTALGDLEDAVEHRLHDARRAFLVVDAAQRDLTVGGGRGRSRHDQQQA
jgi:hypothetical protein